MRTTSILHRSFTKLSLIGGVFALAISSAHAVLVTWDLNPTNANASVGSSSQTFTSSGYSITAYGFDQVAGPDTGHTLFYKNSGLDHGLGLVGTLNNELQVNPDGSLPHYIQFDLSSLLLQGFTNGQIKISSVDPGEAWDIYGSNTLGSLGTKLNAAAFNDTTNNSFVNIPNFGTYKYISVGSNIDDVLPWAIQANVTPVPEAASILPVVCLISIATAIEVRRRRRATA
jgi:hypothetical protein